MRIAVGSDHAGFRLKQAVLDHLSESGVDAEDCGCLGPDPVDYPDVAQLVTAAVRGGRCDLGILICSTGTGMSIAANKVDGIRAALCHDTFSAHRAREHNDANILCMGEWVIGPGLAREIVSTFLRAEFAHEAERHVRRVGKVTALEQTQDDAHPDERSPEQKVIANERRER